MEPRTPPRSSRHRGVPATPATPRFGTFEDLPDFPAGKSEKNEQPSHKEQETPQQTPQRHLHLPTPSTHRRGQHQRKRSANILATPKQTPKRRKDPFQTPQAASSKSDESDKVFDDLMDEFTRADEDAEAQRKETQQKPTAAAHPHQLRPPPDVPGMWYVFRGKKIFRPLPPGAQKPEPVTLFQDEIMRSKSAAGGETGSDAETDVEF